MQDAITCPSCGASNDPIVTNCQFCESSLPNSVDPSELPEATLLNNASEWLAKLETIANDYTQRGQARWSLFCSDIHSVGDIRANAERYINLLSVRSGNNPALATRLERLNNRHERALDNLEANTAREKRMLILIGVGAFGMLLLMGLGSCASLFMTG